ncbi:MAG: hypothetical protein KBE91_01600 [Bacteroidia bacterium]|nr:hypothetical protein [Bacteroidia bacterium]
MKKVKLKDKDSYTFDEIFLHIKQLAGWKKDKSKVKKTTQNKIISLIVNSK